MRRILVTGFGPFPGAPFNPTEALVKVLARQRRPSIEVIGHVFETSYTAVDRDLPALIARHRPDALLVFGLHGRTRTLRIETLARNALGRHTDAGGARPKTHTIAKGGSPVLPLRFPAHRLLLAVKSADVPAMLSRNAGTYLCNYLCWRAAEAAKKPRGPRLTAFIHVPPVVRKPLRRRATPRKLFSPAILARAGQAALAAVTCCLGSVGNRT